MTTVSAIESADIQREILPESRESCTAEALQVRLAGSLRTVGVRGGGEIQVEQTYTAIRKQGVDARIWRPWEEGFEGFDCLHLFGSCREHLEVIDGARRAGVAVVLSPIAWFDLASRWHSGKGLVRRLWEVGKGVCRRQSAWIPDWRGKMYRDVDVLLPNSIAEAEQLRSFFGIGADRIHVVPNGVDDRFREATPSAFRARYGEFDFALYAGRIEPRKNTLGFLRAMRGSGIRTVVIGGEVTGHEAYLARCHREAEQTTFVGHLDHDDPMLASAYAAARCLVLPSWFETPGLAALEAATTGTPLVLGDRGAGREYFGGHAQYVSPRDLRGIRAATLRAMRAPRSTDLAEHVRANFTWQQAAKATKDAYVLATQLQNR